MMLDSKKKPPCFCFDSLVSRTFKGVDVLWVSSIYNGIHSNDMFQLIFHFECKFLGYGISFWVGTEIAVYMVAVW